MYRDYEKEGVLKLTADKLPLLEPILLRTSCMTSGERIRSARRRRRFNLVEDWTVKVSCWRGGDLTGEFVVPREYERRLQEFDGASVPCPWLVTAVSGGVLRPLGVMLIASIIHDFAFAYGFLLFREHGKLKKREIGRRDADRLFHDIIVTVNEMPVVAWIGYAAVRAGWLVGVKYGEKRWGWDAVPWKGMSVAIVTLGLLAWGAVELAAVVLAWIECVGCDGVAESGEEGLLLKAAKLYLVPSGVLVAALGVARSEILKTGVSAIGLLVAALWGWSTLCEVGCSRLDRSLWVLPWVFGGLWALSLLTHGVRWSLGLGEADGAGRKGNKADGRRDSG